MLTRTEIDEILRLIDGSDFTELRIEMGEFRLELRRPGAAAAPALQTAPQPEPQPALRPVPQPAPADAPPKAPDPAFIAGGVDVPAPLLGTFYHSPRPGELPFVRPGDRVLPDTVIGIIEVMKLMTSVPAGIAGEVVQIVASDATLVEHGQTLIRVRPA